MRRNSAMHTHMESYKGYDIDLFLTGPLDKVRGRDFMVTMRVSRDGEEILPGWKDSDLSYETLEEAQRVGTTLARQAIDNLD